MRPPVRGAAGVLLHAYRDLATHGDERQPGTTPSPCYPPAAFSFEDQPRRLQACAFTVPGWNVGTQRRSRTVNPATGDPQPTRDDTSATIHPVPGSSVFWGESVSAPSVAWFVDLAPTMWARRRRRKEAEPLPAVRALHLPREDLPERPRSHQVTAGAFLQRRAPAALVPRWPSQDADVARAGSGARESRSSRSRADAAPARGLRPSRPDQMLRPH